MKEIIEMNKNKLFAIYVPLLILLTITVVSFRTAALLIDFDPSSGYFDNKTLINIADIATAAGALLLFTYAPIRGGGERLIASFTTPATYIPTGIVGMALAFFSADCFIRYRSLDRTFGELLAARSITGMLLPILGALSLLAIGYFILNATVEDRASEPRSAFGLSAVLLLALYATYLYFDSSLPLNAPNKIVDQMAYLFSALFFLYEIRISLGREKWNLYIAFGFIAALLTGVSSLPSIVVYFANGLTVSNNIGENVLTLCIFIFIVSRISLVAKLRVDAESEFVAMMREASAERDAYISERSRKIESAMTELLASRIEEEAAVENTVTAEEDDLIEIEESEDTEEEKTESSEEESDAEEIIEEKSEVQAEDSGAVSDVNEEYTDKKSPDENVSDTEDELLTGETEAADKEDEVLTKTDTEYLTEGAILKYTGKESAEDSADKNDTPKEKSEE